jgi:hypothetical protein
MSPRQQLFVHVDSCRTAVLGSVYHGGEALLEVRYTNTGDVRLSSLTIEVKPSNSSSGPMTFRDQADVAVGAKIAHTLRLTLPQRRHPSYDAKPICTVTEIDGERGVIWISASPRAE